MVHQDADSVLVGVPRIERRMGEVTRRESGARGPTPSRENHQRPQDSARTELPRLGRPGIRWEGWPVPATGRGVERGRLERASEGRRPAPEGWEGGRKENISFSQTWLLEPENGHERSGAYRAYHVRVRLLNELEMRPE